MAKNRMSVDFKGVDQYLEQLKKVDGAAERAVETALKATQELIADKAAAAMEPHNKSHVTADQIIRDGVVDWTQQTAAISVGFQIEDESGMPGLPSIFLMHGTKLHGQPHITRDQVLYDAVYGKATKQEARKLQQAAFDRILAEVIA
jgi:hypothetical protein